VDLLDGLDILANLDCTANNFVTDTERKGNLAPTTSDGVDIRSADTTGVNGNVNVAILERLELELLRYVRKSSSGVESVSVTDFLLLELSPFLRVLNDKASGGLRVRHFGGDMW